MTVLCILFGLHAIAGSVDTIEMKSAYLKKAVKFVIVQPSKQSQQNSIQERYPVVYLLNGYDGNYAQWSKTAPQLAKTSDDLKIIFVCADGGKSSWYFDSPIDSTSQYESYITKELVPYVDANFSTRAKMGQSSDVYAVAIMADGRALFAKKEVKVTLGGCGG